MLMILPPQPKQGAPVRRQFGKRERWFVRLAGLLAVALVGAAIFSLTSHSPKNGHGCIAFNYTMVLGGEQFYECGKQAKRTCASPPNFGGQAENFPEKLRDACHGAKMPYATASS